VLNPVSAGFIKIVIYEAAYGTPAGCSEVGVRSALNGGSVYVIGQS